MFHHWVCCYCGQNSDGFDHVIPWSYSRNKNESKNYKRSEVVPCCRQCNSVLRNHAMHTIADRAGYLYYRYNQKWRKILQNPHWEKSELNKLEGNLKQYVRLKKTEQNICKIRIDHLRQVMTLDWLTPSGFWDIAEGDKSLEDRKI